MKKELKICFHNQVDKYSQLCQLFIFCVPLHTVMKKENEYTKWVACWGNATSISDRKEATFAKDLTLRYPLFMPFDGSRLRLRFSNLTGTEPVTLTRSFVALKQEDYVSLPVLFSGRESVTINPGCEVESDEIELMVPAGSTLNVSMYFEDFTQLNADVREKMQDVADSPK